MNDLLDRKGTVDGRWNAYNALKGQWFGQIKTLVVASRLPAQGPGYASALWVEPHRQRDPDNVTGGGFKLLLDAFVGCEIIAGDGWNDVLGLIGHWVLQPGRAGCLFHWGDELLSKASMLELLEKEERDGTAINGRRTTGNESGRAAAQKAARGHARSRRALGGR